MGGGGGNTASSTGALPFWVQSAHQNLVGSSEDFVYGDRGAYQAYEGDRIAALTPQEQQANIAREEMFNRGDVAGQFAANQLDKAAGLTDEVRDVAFSEFTQDEYQRRRNPYIDNVVNREIQEANESFNRRLNQDQAASVARGGSIGSYRVGLENAFLEQERAQSLGDIRAQGELDAYNQALGQFESDRGVRLGGLGQAATQYGGIASGANQLGTDSQAREMGLIRGLETSGAIQREMAQREADLAYGDFREEQDWPKQQMSWLSGILSGVPNQQLASTTHQSAQPGLVSQLAGLGLGAAAISQYL